MNVTGLAGAAGLGLAFAMSAAVSGGMAAEPGLSAFQGAWLQSSPSCAEVYSFSGKDVSFRSPVDIFAPAFIISGNRLRTPQASCRIRSVRPASWADRTLRWGPGNCPSSPPDQARGRNRMSCASAVGTCWQARNAR